MEKNLNDVSTWTAEDDMPSPLDSESEELSTSPLLPPFYPPRRLASESPNRKNKQAEECFTISQRVYENVPTESLNEPKNFPSEEKKTKREFLSATELMNCMPIPPSSRISWGDSGRESLSFDGDSNSCKNLLIPPPPPPPAGSSGGLNSYFRKMTQGDEEMKQSPAKKSRRLVRQKHCAMDTGDYSDKNTGTFLAVPSPRRHGGHHSINHSNNHPNIHHHHQQSLQSPCQQQNFLGHHLGHHASPISLQRHPNSSQLLLQENKKSRPLIPCEAPYGMTSGNFNNSTNLFRAKSPKISSQFTRFGVGQQNQSFDYGELPSHQMFPKRHLLQHGRNYGHNPPSGGNNCNNGNAPAHRSFPAALFGPGPRSCSMGDLSGSPGSVQTLRVGEMMREDHLTNTVPLVTSLPPATSVTYEYSLAPVSGTLAPGWHLTAVQRGLATAVPLAAVVARRRIPRPRPPRFGFKDKNEARRAKWTIVVTALALLAMSMLLVGVTLRLAPLIDDLVRKENEDLMNRIGTQPNWKELNSSTTTTTTTPPIPVGESETPTIPPPTNHYDFQSEEILNSSTTTGAPERQAG